MFVWIWLSRHSLPSFKGAFRSEKVRVDAHDAVRKKVISILVHSDKACCLHVLLPSITTYYDYLALNIECSCVGAGAVGAGYMY